jgi:hypothetical protein
MRTLGMIAIFLLSLVAIVEGAYLFKLSRQVTALTEDRTAAAETDDLAAPAARRAEAPAPRPRPSAPMPVPTFQAMAPPSTTPATTTLREALATTEGREQLKAAMEVIAEEKRQARLIEWAPRRDERDQKYRERIHKAVALTGDEPLKLDALFTTMQTNRRQIIEDMRAGLKNAEKADDELDELRDTTEKSIHALLGDERYKKIRGDRRNNGRGGEGQQQGQGQPQGQAPQGQAPSVAAGPGR